MGDITNPRVLWLKFGLFIATGVLALTIALVMFPSVRLAGLMFIAVWAFCRSYYFAFYVIEHYADPSYRFAGIGSFICYMFKRRKQR